MTPILETIARELFSAVRAQITAAPIIGGMIEGAISDGIIVDAYSLLFRVCFALIGMTFDDDDDDVDDMLCMIGDCVRDADMSFDDFWQMLLDTSTDVSSHHAEA